MMTVEVLGIELSPSSSTPTLSKTKLNRNKINFWRTDLENALQLGIFYCCGFYFLLLFVGFLAICRIAAFFFFFETITRNIILENRQMMVIYDSEL